MSGKYLKRLAKVKKGLFQAAAVLLPADSNPAGIPQPHCGNEAFLVYRALC